jgi:amidophosphoribosyltransferase
LSRKYPIDGDIVIPVPDSARPAALGYSEASKIPFEEGLMKDRYGRRGGIRSFIEPTQRDREEINRWVVAVKPIVEGKHVIVIDDSIVRGTSSRWIGRTLRAGGARRVSLLLTFPPIRFPCYMGIDFPNQEELLAFRVGGMDASLEEINARAAEAIGVDFVGYNDLGTLSQGIALPPNSLCSSCVTGDYSCLKKPPIYKTREQMKG